MISVTFSAHGLGEVTVSDSHGNACHFSRGEIVQLKARIQEALRSVHGKSPKTPETVQHPKRQERLGK